MNWHHEKRKGLDRFGSFSPRKGCLSGGARSQAGMAYVALLILLAMLSTLVLTFIFKVGVGSSSAENHLHAMEAHYLAEAAANHAMWRLLYDSASGFASRVGADADDAEEEENGDMRLDDNHVELGKRRFVGVRFRNVTIPKGAKIVNAHVAFQASDDDDHDVSLTVYGHDADNGAAFTSGQNDLSDRSKTTAAISWNIVSQWTKNATYQSPDLAPIIQEIVNRPGWSGGNALALLFQSDVFDNKRRAVSHNGQISRAPALYVRYGDAVPVANDRYYMHSFAGGRYGYKIRYHTKTTFATVATVGAVGDNAVNQSYVLYVKPTGWYDPGWLYRQRITLSPLVTDTALTDFPYLVKIVDPANGLFLNALSNGDDILFTASDGTTRLDHELERYDAAGNALYAWVKVPLLSSTDPTPIYMYYDNAGASNQENPSGVWSNGYEAVYHLNDDFKDSLNSHNGTNTGSTDVPGPVADGQDFYPADGVDKIRLGDWKVQGDRLTIQAWVKSDDAFAQNEPRAISKAKGTSAQDHVWMMGLDNGTINRNRLRFRLKTGNKDGEGTTTLLGSTPNGYLPVAEQWYLVAMTYDGSQMRIIRDGLDGGSVEKSGNLRETGWKIDIGNNPQNTDQGAYSWDGKIDEVRISSVARSMDWMRAEYRNQAIPETYQSVGDPETEDGS